MNYRLADYIKASETKQKMPRTYSIVRFDEIPDGNMLYGISKTCKFCDGSFIGDKTWIFINDGMKSEIFEEKLNDYLTKFHNKGFRLTITTIYNNGN